MPSIDERIVAMAFENAKFEAGVAQTLATLAKLDASLQKIGTQNSLGNIEQAANKVTLQQPMSALDKLKAHFGSVGQGAAQGFSDIERAGSRLQLLNPLTALDKIRSRLSTVGTGAADGFNEIERASGRVSLQGLTSSLDSVTAKFSVLQGAASVAIGNITSQAAMRGATFVKSFAFGPIQQGFGEYKTNLSSIQTILANTQGQQVSGLAATNKYLQELNTYSDQTIYNFSEMAKNIGTFTAAGVDLPKATQAIKGIANLAALSGSNSQQASTAMYQLSQAIAAGRVGLQDWNSVVNAGMGGAVFQKSLMRTAENMGALKKGAVEIDKATGKATVNGQSFRESIMAKPGQHSWLTSEVLTSTLGQLTGDMTDAQLAAKGFTQEQIKAIQAQAKTAKAAATEVKNISQVFDVAKETIGSGWANTFQKIFGDFNQSKKTFTELSNAINGVINRTSKARNALLGGWEKLGGRTQLIEGLKNAFTALSRLLTPIGKAFRDIFPPQTSKSLFDLTKNFADFTKRLEPTSAMMLGLQRTFRGLFAVVHIGWTVVKGLIGVIADLLGVVGHGSGGFLNFTGSIGDFLVSIDNALTKGRLLTSFFDGLSQILQIPLRLLGGIASAIFGLFGGVDKAKATVLGDSMGKVQKAAGPLTNVLHGLKTAWDGLVKLFRQAKELVSPWLDHIGQQLSGLSDVFTSAFTNMNFDKVMSALQTGFIGGLFLVIKKAITGGTTQLSAVMGGFKNVLSGLTGQLQAMQQNVRATIILKIATAIGILAASTFALAKIDPVAMTRAMTAIAVGLGELMGAMRLMTSGLGFVTGIALVPVLSASLVVLASSLVVLAAAVKIFSTMSWQELAKGLAGVGGGLAAIGVGMKLLGPGTLVQGPAILVLAVALNALALAVKQFASLKWEELARGLAGVLGTLVALIAPMTEFAPGLLLTGPGLIAVAFAMNMLAGAVRAFGDMNLKTLGIGLLGVSASIVAIGLGIGLIPPTIALQAVGLTILAVALTGIAGAVKMFGSVGILGLVKGLTAMGAALGILSLGLMGMVGTMPGSLALLAAATALALLAPTLGFLGTLNWGTIFKGLAAMALALGVLSVAGELAAPGLVALGVALLPLAGVFVLTAGAVFIFAKALEVLGSGGTKGVGVMVAALTAFIAILPKIIIDFAKGVVDIFGEMAKLAPSILKALGTLFSMIIVFVADQAPKLAVAVGAFLQAFYDVVVQNLPGMISTGMIILTSFLQGIATNIGQITTLGATIITAFLTSLTAKLPDMIAAGGGVIVAFITGVGSYLGQLVAAGVTMIGQFVIAVASQAGRLVTIGANAMLGFISSIGSYSEQLVTRGVNVILNFLSGVGLAIPQIAGKGLEVAGKFLHAVANGLVRMADIGATAVIRFLNGLAAVIRDKGPELRNAGWNLASAILDGMVGGFKDLGHRAVGAVKGLIGSLPGAAMKILGIHSPSTVFAEIGRNAMIGLAQGLRHSAPERSMVATGARLVKTAEQAMKRIPTALEGMIATDPVISPVLDLSAVEKEAKKLDGLTNVVPIRPTVSIDQATAVSQETAATIAAAQAAAATPVVNEIKFEQNNHSPESLSDVEVYRQTRNLLSAAKRELGLSATA